MHAIRVLICLALISVLVPKAPAGEISPAVAGQLADLSANEPLTVLVYLHGAVDIKTLDQNLHADRASMAVRHQTVIEALRDAAEAAQADLVTELATAKGRGDIVDFRRYWIINAVRVTAGESTIRAIAARLDVDTIEPELKVELIEPVKRQPASTRGIGITPGVVNINARRVWNELGIRGEGALIGSLDTGVDGNHPALADRWRGNHAPWQECWLDVLGTGTQFPTDLDSHGTHCTGTMTGLAADDTIGVAPAAEWIAANPIDQYVSSDFDADIIACFEWFTDPDGDPSTLDDVPDVVQNSWGVDESFGYPDCDSRWWEAIDACEAAGPVVVFAAGNEGPYESTLRSPGDRATSHANCYTVGATRHSPPFEIASFSARGPAGPDCGPDEYRIKPEVAAPGVDVYSSVPGNNYDYFDGTSMAAPHVCGVVALMRSANPDADVITIKEVLMGTARDLGEVGEDNVYGHGFIDAYAAVVQIMGGFGQVEGIVTDTETGNPVAGVEVELLGGYGQATTDEAGYYTFGLPEGPQTIEARAYSYEILHQPVTGIPGEMVTANLVMTRLPLTTVSGTVYLPGGNPIDGGIPAAGAHIDVVSADEPSVTADDLGRYTLSLPYGDDYHLAVTSGIDGRLALTVPFFDDLELDLYLNEGNAEGFESGDLEGFGWSTAGAPWTVQGDEVHSGNFAARSGAIGDGQYSQIHKFINCGSGGQMTMWFKVSSEEGDDFLRAYDGNILLGEWSGEMDWTQASFTVGSGTRHIRFRYQKGSSGSNGADAAWLDDIIFPGLADPEPKLVIAPLVVAVTMESPEVTTAPGYLFNMGGDDLSWAASESADWLALSPPSGSTPTGSYQPLDLTFDATDLLDGVYTATIAVNSTDPVNPVMNFQASLTLTTDISHSPADQPRALAIHGAAPNPFNPMTVVRFSVPSRQHVTLGMYDIRGRLVRTVIDGELASGLHSIPWDGRDDQGRGVASGTYFARLLGGGQVSVKSLMLVR